MERVRMVNGRPALLGGRCKACGHTTFPRRTRCPSCRSAAVEEAGLGSEGVVETGVDLHVSTAEAQAPYALAFVRLERVRLLARVTGVREPGAPVQLEADVDSDSFWFTAANVNGNTSTTEEMT